MSTELIISKEQKTLEEIRKNLSKYLEKYISAILQEYGDSMPIHEKKNVEQISDYENILKYNLEKTITFVCSGQDVYLPQYASQVIGMMKHIPGYGINRNHKCYKNNEILNNTSYFGYIKHVLLAGLSVEEFYLETLLHETVHLCGSSGSEPFREGLTELKARELSQKYGFPLSRCGYNKEVDIAAKVQDILGADLINRITFTSDEFEVKKLISERYGEEAYKAVMSIRSAMAIESDKKYEATRFKGPFSAIKKAFSYTSLNYSKVYPLIDQLRSIMTQEQLATKDKCAEFREKRAIQISSLSIRRRTTKGCKNIGETA